MIGIIGNGFVGQATSLFGDALIYDIVPEKCIPSGLTLEHLVESCDIIFLCLPTPITSQGRCYVNTVRKVSLELELLINMQNKKPHIVLRSTVPPGTCLGLGVHHMPEFLTEKNWERDFKETNGWIIGVNKNNHTWQKFIIDISNLLHEAKETGKINSSRAHFCTTRESEMVKYTRNVYLATKVSFFNEIEEFCRSKNINYDKVRELVIKDPRIGESHTAVPGPDGKRGVGGTCLPKDTSALYNEMTDSGVKSFIIKNVIKRNNTHDRPDKDWAEDTGRSTI